jgi:hypothetical protein
MDFPRKRDEAALQLRMMQTNATEAAKAMFDQFKGFARHSPLHDKCSSLPPRPSPIPGGGGGGGWRFIPPSPDVCLLCASGKLSEWMID